MSFIIVIVIIINLIKKKKETELKQIFETVIGVINQSISNDAWKTDAVALDLLAACVTTLEKILNWNFSVLCTYTIPYTNIF